MTVLDVPQSSKSVLAVEEKCRPERYKFKCTKGVHNSLKLETNTRKHLPPLSSLRYPKPFEQQFPSQNWGSAIP